jgi:LemA protein
MDTHQILERLYRLRPPKPRRSLVRRLWTRVLDRAQRYASGLVIGSLIFGAWVASHIYYYNILLDLEANTDTALAQIQVAEQKRDHLRRSMTQLLRFHAGYERDVLKELTKLRGPSQRTENEGAPEALARLDAVGEQYPNLQLNTTIKQLSDAMVAAEMDVAKRIYDYNDAVNMYTARLHQFPGNLFGRPLGFRDREHYKPQDTASLNYQEVAP